MFFPTSSLPSIHIIAASTSGHTDYVIDVLIEYLLKQNPTLILTRQRAEEATASDLVRADLLILASGTWNFDGIEGQLNERMHRLLFERAKASDLQQQPVAIISLGDDRYYFTTRCTEHFIKFIQKSHAKNILPPLIIVNEPYEQKERIQKWGEKISMYLQKKS